MSDIPEKSKELQCDTQEEDLSESSMPIQNMQSPIAQNAMVVEDIKSSEVQCIEINQ